MPSLPTDLQATDAQSKESAPVIRFPVPDLGAKIRESIESGIGAPVERMPRYPALAPINPSPRPSSHSRSGHDKRSLPTYIDVSDRSSWIAGFGYHNTYLAVFFKSGSATLYYNVPAQIPGLLAAGNTNTKLQSESKHGERRRVLSVGATYNRLIKGIYEGESISDPEKVRELRKLMGGK